MKEVIQYIMSLNGRWLNIKSFLLAKATTTEICSAKPAGYGPGLTNCRYIFWFQLWRHHGSPGTSMMEEIYPVLINILFESNFS